MQVVVGARSSPLSRAQVEEFAALIPELLFSCRWVLTPGDRDRSISLRGQLPADFFTRDLDQMLLRKEIDVAIHSAKDLPDPLPKGLALIALTKGVSAKDSLVFRGDAIPKGGVIAASSLRREEAVRALDPSFRFVDLRGTIGERLALLERGEVDGVVVAEAALIRLKLTHLKRLILESKTPPLQGRLAAVARAKNVTMRRLFAPSNHK